MLRFPNCKINLGLYITGKREDGYHNLETVFYPVPLTDVLEIVPAKATALHLSGKAVAGDERKNLVWRAYELLQEMFPIQMGKVDIYLHKLVPMGAGMGGGSADGAFMLQMVNDEFSLGLTKPDLAKLALQLGSDCPFFIYNTPQFAGGRGEDMTPVKIDLSAYSIQLICPEVHISTAKAFSMLTPKPAPFNLKGLANLPVSEWKDKIGNDFEASIFAEHPGLAGIKQQLYDQGAIYASMSGSGSTIYGIFEKGEKAEVKSELAFEQSIL
ncbi:MAG: 4-(cytidine 5'-diphospho)-2-C-methyl-D-erythritol kinase [Sphingobacteriales bacterium]|nr:MAG: 4-(cytidine 5'-diphospho)-2-C-methyl-D-erythritol kinase [Sphingobacteriales bacterium]